MVNPLSPQLPGTPPTGLAPLPGTPTAAVPPASAPIASGAPTPPVFDLPPGGVISGPPVAVPPPGATIIGGPAAAPVAGPPAITGPPVLSGPVAAPMASASGLTLSPSRLVAPVGSEVVLLAGVTGQDGQPAPNARVEWLLSPESAGQLLKVGEGGWCLWRHFKNQPRKIDNRYALGSTVSQLTVLDRGTPSPADDIQVNRGQAWVTLSSPTDGVSHVTAFAPNVANWDGRKQTASIYWIDGQFSFPAPTIGPVGTRQQLTTNVTRSSDGTPVEGWLVRYEIISEDGAAFAPDGSRALEVLTSVDGAATVELYQQQPGRGVTQVDIQVIRPNMPGEGGSRRLAIGRGTTNVTWTAAEVALRVTGPAQAEVGAAATFRIEVSNPGNLPVEGVQVVGQLPRNMRFERSNVPANQAGGLSWQLGQLAAGATQTIEIECRCEQAGPSEFCAELSAANAGAGARQCATVDVTAPAALDLVVTGPSTARVGEEVTFNFKITNRSEIPTSGTEITIEFDEGLVHEQAAPGQRQLKSPLGGLAPGQVRDNVDVTFRVTKAGTLCHTSSVRASGVRATEVRKCLTVSEAPQGVSPGIDVQSAGPRVRRVGENAMFETTIRNTGDVTLTNLRIEAVLEPSLKAINASRGFRKEGDRLIWDLPSLAVGQSHPIRVEARCLDVDANACMNISVVADPNVITGSDACVAIEATDPLDDGGNGGIGNGGIDNGDPDGGVPGGVPDGDFGGGQPAASSLIVEMTDLSDEIPVDGNVVYEVRITNPGNEADSNVVMVVHVPAGLEPLEVQEGAPATHTIEGQRIRFNPVQTIRKDETLTYRIVLRAKSAGQHTVEAFVTSGRDTTAIIGQEETSVYHN